MSTAYRLLSPRPMASRVLLLFPFAGAGASIFREWSAYLPSYIEPWALQLPGREDRLNDACFTNWGDAVMAAMDDGREIAGGRPVVLYGHSLGALMALNVASSLKEKNVSVESTVVGAPPKKKAAANFGSDGDPLSRLEVDYGPAPASFESPDIRDVVLPILEADLKLLANAPVLEEVPDHLLLGRDDPSAAEAKKNYPGVPITEIDAGHYFASTHPAETMAALMAAIR